MNPGQRISELVDWRFPQFDEEVEKVATKFASIHDDTDLEKDVTIDAIDHEVRFDFDRIVDSQEPETYAKAPYRNDDDTLTEAGRNYIRSYLNNVRDYEGLLTEMPEEEFDKLYKDYERNSRSEVTSHTRFRERMAFYNSAGADADFVRWFDAEVWSAEDAVALSLGKDPRVVNSEALGAVSSSSPFLKAFNDRLDLLRRAIKAQTLPADIPPAQFVGWARSKKWEIPAQLSDIPLASVVKVIDGHGREKQQRKSAETRVENTLLAILAALLAIKYNWDLSDAARSRPAGLPKITDKLMNDLRAEAEAQGLELVTNNSLRGWLERAIAESGASALARLPEARTPAARAGRTAEPTARTESD